MQKELFKKLDSDGDGKLTSTEFSAGKPDDVTDSMSEDLFSQLDSDGDGSLTESEMTSAAQPPPPPPGNTEALDSLASSLASLIEELDSSESTDSASETDSESSYLELLQEILEEAQQKLEESAGESSSTSTDSTSTSDDTEEWLEAIKNAASEYYTANASDSSSLTQDEFVSQVATLAQTFVSTLQEDAGFRSQQAQLAAKFTQ